MNTERIIANATIQLLRENAFYGHIMCKIAKKESSIVPTFAVGKESKDSGIMLHINPDYVKNCYKKANDDLKAFTHIVQILKHEILHVVFRHLWSDLPASHEREIAHELAVNSYIDRAKLIDDGIFPEDYGFPSRLSSKEYYELLKSENKNKSLNSDTDSNGSDGSSENKPSSPIDSHDLWKDVGEDTASDIQIKEILRKSKEIAERSKEWGSVPEEIKRIVDSLINPSKSEISWQEILRNFIGSSSKTELEYTKRRYSRRFGTRPGIYKQEQLRVAVGIDTSGSIDTLQLSQFFNELDCIFRHGTDITVFEADSEIHREYSWNGIPESEVTGGGGTDLEPVIKEASERNFDCLIYFTDGYAPKINKKYKIPSIFVLYGRSPHYNTELPYKPDYTFIIGEQGEVQVLS